MAKKLTPLQKSQKTQKENKKKNQAKFIAALIKSNGVVTVACKATNISRPSHYRWYKEDEDYREAVDEIDNLTAEYVEGQLMKLIRQLHPQSIMFYLKTKGKKRGWTGSIEITGDEDKPLVWNEVKKYKKNN